MVQGHFFNQTSELDRIIRRKIIPIPLLSLKIQLSQEISNFPFLLIVLISSLIISAAVMVVFFLS